MKNNNCKYCGGTFKISTTEYTIRSRHSQKSETTIENLSVNECTICGHTEMPESSEKYIEMIRQKIRNEMEANTMNSSRILKINNATPLPKSESNPIDNHLNNIMKMFKKFIG